MNFHNFWVITMSHNLWLIKLNWNDLRMTVKSKRNYGSWKISDCTDSKRPYICHKRRYWFYFPTLFKFILIKEKHFIIIIMLIITTKMWEGLYRVKCQGENVRKFLKEFCCGKNVIKLLWRQSTKMSENDLTPVLKCKRSRPQKSKN